jgi:hypothetical protein
MTLYNKQYKEIWSVVGTFMSIHNQAVLRSTNFGETPGFQLRTRLSEICNNILPMFFHFLNMLSPVQHPTRGGYNQSETFEVGSWERHGLGK